MKAPPRIPGCKEPVTDRIGESSDYIHDSQREAERDRGTSAWPFGRFRAAFEGLGEVETPLKANS